MISYGPHVLGCRVCGTHHRERVKYTGRGLGEMYTASQEHICRSICALGLHEKVWKLRSGRPGSSEPGMTLSALKSECAKRKHSARAYNAHRPCRLRNSLAKCSHAAYCPRLSATKVHTRSCVDASLRTGRAGGKEKCPPTAHLPAQH